MTPEQLIAWHAHQITFLPATDNAVVQLHREAMHCVVRLRTGWDSVARREEEQAAEIERLRGLLREARQSVWREANDEREMEGRGYYCDLAHRIDAALKEEK